MVSFRLIPAARHLWLFYELKKKRITLFYTVLLVGAKINEIV